MKKAPMQIPTMIKILKNQKLDTVQNQIKSNQIRFITGNMAHKS